MSANNNNRIQIPEFITKFVELEQKKDYGVFLEPSNLFFFLDSPDSDLSALLVAICRLDEKNRFSIPRRLWNLIQAENEKELIFFPKNGNIYFTSIAVIQQKNGLL